MCVIIHKPAKTTIDRGDILDMFYQNSDGFGAMWAEDGVIHTFRALPESEEAAWAMYQQLPTDKELVLHYRMATHGSVRVENSHPFEVRPDVYLVHNGVLSVDTLKLDTQGDRTDTEAYITAYLQPLLAQASDPLAMVRDKAFQRMIGAHIGGNKFALMDAAGQVTIINRGMGEIVKRKGGTFWASNTHWEYAIADTYRYTERFSSGKGKKGKKGRKSYQPLMDTSWGTESTAYRAAAKDEDDLLDRLGHLDEPSELGDMHEVFDPLPEEVDEFHRAVLEAMYAADLNATSITTKTSYDYLCEVGLYTAWELLEDAQRDLEEARALRDDMLLWNWQMSAHA